MSDQCAPVQDRAELLHRLEQRRRLMMHEGHIDNGSLYAEQPMFYYCKYCGVLTDIMPEDWLEKTPGKLCQECEILLGLGWHDNVELHFPIREVDEHNLPTEIYKG